MSKKLFSARHEELRHRKASGLRNALNLIALDGNEMIAVLISTVNRRRHRDAIFSTQNQLDCFADECRLVSAVSWDLNQEDGREHRGLVWGVKNGRI